MRRLLVMFAGAVVLVLAGAPAVFAAQAPFWHIGSEVSPTHLPPGGKGEIVVVLSNLGDAPIEAGGTDPVRIADTLPTGLTVQEAAGAGVKCKPEMPIKCTYEGILYPYEQLTVTVKVSVSPSLGSPETLSNEVLVTGGGAPEASSEQHVTVSTEEAPFGVQGYELSPYDEVGESATQAGSHPFQLTTTLVMNQTGLGSNRQPVKLPKDLRFELPPGLIGDPSAVEQCSMIDFSALVDVTNLCSPRSVVGVASATVYEPDLPQRVLTLTVPVFNLVPAQGEPARFGFEVIGKVPIVIDTSVSTGGDYAVVASVQNATQTAGLLSSQVTLWGVPGDPRHDSSRGWECIEGGKHVLNGELSTPCPASPELPLTPFLTLPSACSVERLSSSAQAEAWTQSGFVQGPLGEALGLNGCAQLPFAPTIGVSPEEGRGAPVRDASTPTGLTVNVKVPQARTLEPNPNGLAEADVRETVVRLPAGMALNPSAANGLQACPEAPAGGYEGMGFTGFQKFYGPELEGAPETATFTSTFRFKKEEVQGKALLPSCPEASKVGTVRIRTPLLPGELEGAVYLAEPDPKGEGQKNPFNSLIALYIVAEDHEAGILVKQAGRGELNQVTGQVTTRFQNIPQVPFEELKVELFGGERASVSTPAFCGAPDSEAEFTSWSSRVPVDAVSALEVSAGVGGGSCPPDPLVFSPGFGAHVTNTNAGAFTSFQLQIARSDGQQALTGVTVHLPAGIAALLSTVTPCQEPPIGQEWSCGSESEIGQSTAVSGLGEEPVTLPAGQVYLTSGYDGAPFGILVRTKAQAGPFDLGYVNVRSKIEVDPETAAVTITTDPGPRDEVLPSILMGVPAQLKAIDVNIDRPGFEFNPTSCAPTRIEGTLHGSEGANAGVSSPFQVGGCQGLPFAPTLAASTKGQASKADGTSLNVTVTSAGLGQENIQKVDLQLPKALSSRLTTLQKACTESAFNADPASCDPESVIGHATIHTPVLKNPLSGPAYLVSHGGAAFPDLEFVLQGEGVKIVLDGKTDIKEGITYSRFESAPDAPFTRFETELPAGPDSILTANVPEKEDYDLCKASLDMPTTIVAQDGAVLESSTKIVAEGCGEVKSSKVKKLTRAQQLAKALKACRTRYKHSKAKRANCEKLARKRYGPQKKKAAARKNAKKTTTAAHHA